MSSSRMRPEFVYSLASGAAKFFEVLELSLSQPDAPCRGTCFGVEQRTSAILRRHEVDQHYWSPALHLFVESHGDGGSIELRGRFSPSSPVWTAFLAIYLVLALVAIGGCCYGGAQALMGESAWALLAVPIAAALAGFTYGAAFIGQGLGAEDMFELRGVVERAVRDADSSILASP